MLNVNKNMNVRNINLLTIFHNLFDDAFFANFQFFTVKYDAAKL
jgi:hypothetical protein